MNIDQIQKINALAMDLLRQGLATDREDAVRQAERVYEHRYGDSATTIRQTQQAVQAEAQPQPKSAGAVVTNDPDLSSEKVKEILEKNTQFLVKTIKEFQEKVSSMEKDIASLRQNIVNSRVERMSQPVQRGGEESSPIQRGKTESPSASNHPRTGTFKEGEVSIEKFFNYSGKR